MLTVIKFHISPELKIWSIVQPLQVSPKSKSNENGKEYTDLVRKIIIIKTN